MKLPLLPSHRAALFSGVIAVMSFAGCASFDASNQESLLSAAGFKERIPQTARQKELYAAAPSYKVERIAVNGKTFYAYKDEKKGTAFIGGEAEYQRYQQLANQQRIARQNYEAAEMNRDASMGWYSAYGPYAFGPYGYGPSFRMR
jgi:hypothetical protein